MWARVRKNLRILRALALASLQADMEYRANLVFRVLTDTIWYVAQILTFEILFFHTPRLGDWNREETRVFLGILFVVDAIYMIFFQDNLHHLNEKVRRGELDLILAKPVSSRLMVSCYNIATAIFGNLILACGWLAWSIARLPEFQWSRLPWLLVLIPVAVCTLYCLRFFFSTLAIIFTRVDAVQYLWYNFYKLGMRPDSIYAPWLRWLLLTLVPVGIISSVPSRAILDPPDYFLFFYSIAFSTLLFWLTGRFWRYALGKYSSASS